MVEINASEFSVLDFMMCVGKWKSYWICNHTAHLFVLKLIFLYWKSATGVVCLLAAVSVYNGYYNVLRELSQRNSCI